MMYYNLLSYKVNAFVLYCIMFLPMLDAIIIFTVNYILIMVIVPCTRCSARK